MVRVDGNKGMSSGNGSQAEECIQHNREGSYPQGRELATIFNREAKEDLFIYEFE